MALNEASRGTDVMHSRAYLTQMLTHANPLIRAQGKAGLENLDREEQMAFQQANLQENVRSREQAGAQSREAAAARAKELGAYRTDTLAQHAAEERNQNAARMLAALPDIQLAYGKDAPVVTKQILDQFLKQGGITPAAAAPDAATEAAKRHAAASGEQVAQTAPAAQAGPAVQAPTAGARPAPVAGGGEASALRVPEGLTLREALRGAPEGYSTVNAPGGGVTYAPNPTRLSDAERARAEGRPYVQAGQVYGGPQGQDYNVNTGEWSPSSMVGTIDGRPADQVVAEGAIKRGVSPEDARSRTTYNTMQRDLAKNVAGTSPTENVAPSPVARPGQVAPTLPTDKSGFPNIGTNLPTTGEVNASPTAQLASDNLPSGWKQHHVPGEVMWTPPSSEPAPFSPSGLAGPVPNPTPAGTPAPDMFSQIANAPLGPTPTPAGTPSAVPSPQQLAEEARRKRQTGM